MVIYIGKFSVYEPWKSLGGFFFPPLLQAYMSTKTLRHFVGALLRLLYYKFSTRSNTDLNGVSLFLYIFTKTNSRSKHFIQLLFKKKQTFSGLCHRSILILKCSTWALFKKNLHTDLQSSSWSPHLNLLSSYCIYNGTFPYLLTCFSHIFPSSPW